MRDLDHLKVFRDVVSAGGYSAAHRKTGQSRATLSRHVSELEAALGARLIERSTRSFRLTEQGQLLFDRSVDIFAQVDEAFAMVENLQREPSGLVRIAAPPSLLDFQIRDEILRYMRTYSRVRVHIEVSNRQVDLHNEGFDFVLRARTRLDYPQDDVPVLLARMALVLVVAPCWRDALRPTLAETVAQVPVISWQGMSERTIWRLHTATGQPVDLKVQPRLIVDDQATLTSAARAGLGLAMIPEVHVRDDLASGALLRVDADLQPPPSLVHAVHLGHRGMRPAVRHLLDWLKNITRPLREE